VGGHDLPLRNADLAYFTPSFVVDISAVWDRKVEAMTASETVRKRGARSRDRAGRGGSLSIVEARARFFGSMIGVERGEAFHTAGSVPLGFLPGVQDTGLGREPAYRMFH
jgi:hypothetical protein